MIHSLALIVVEYLYQVSALLKVVFEQATKY